MARRSGNLRVVFKGEDKLSVPAAAVVASLSKVALAGQSLSKTFGAFGGGIPIFNAQSASRVNNFASATTKAGNAVGQASRSIARMNSVMGAVGRRVGFATKAMAGFFLVFEGIRGIKSAISTITEFGETMAHLKGVVRPSADEMTRLEGAARSLGATTKFTAKEAGEGLLFLARTGFSVNESISAVSATLDLAMIGMLDLGKAADYASNIVQQFGLRAEDTRRVVDAMAVVANNANTNIEQLAQALKFAGPLAGSLGREVEETAAAIGVLGDRGLQATIAGRGLRGVMASLLKPTAEAKQVFKDLNINLKDLDPTTNKLSKIFSTLKNANLSAADALKVFARESVNQALILTDNATKIAMLEEKQKSMAGESARVAAILNSTLSASFKQLGSAMTEFFLSLGDKGLGPGLKGFLDTLTGSIRILAGFKGALSSASTASIRLAMAIKAIAIAAGVFLSAKIVFYLGSIASGLIKATIAARGFNLALLSNPFTMVATALATVIALIGFYSDKAALAAESTAELEESFDSLSKTAGSLKDSFDKALAAAELGDAASEVEAYEERVRGLTKALIELKKKQPGKLDFGVDVKEFNIESVLPSFDYKSYVSGNVKKIEEYFISELRKTGTAKGITLPIDVRVFDDSTIDKFSKKFGILTAQFDRLKKSGDNIGKLEALNRIRELIDGLASSAKKIPASLLGKLMVRELDMEKKTLEALKIAAEEGGKSLSGYTDEQKKAAASAVDAIGQLQFENSVIGKTASEIRRLSKLRIFENKVISLGASERRVLIDLYKRELELSENLTSKNKSRDAYKKNRDAIRGVGEELNRRIQLARMDADQAAIAKEVWAANAKVQFDNVYAWAAFNAIIIGRITLLKELQAQAEATRKKQEEQKRADEKKEQVKKDISNYVKDLEFEVSLIGKTATERAKAIVKQDLLNRATDSGVEITKELVKYVEMLAGTLENASKGSVNLAKAFKEALADGGVSQASELVFEQINKNIKGTGDQVTVFSASMADAIEGAAKEGLDAITDELLDPIVKAFKDIFGDNGVLTKILTVFFDTFLRTLMRGVFAQMFSNLGLPGFTAPMLGSTPQMFGGSNPTAGGLPSGGSAPLGPVGSVTGTGAGGGPWQSFTGGGDGLDGGVPEQGPIVPLVFPRGSGSPGGPMGPISSPRLPFPVPGAPGAPGAPGGGGGGGGGAGAGAGIGGGGGGQELSDLRKVLSRLEITFPKSRRGPAYPDFDSFARAIKSGIPTAPRPLARDIGGVPSPYLGFTGGGLGGGGGGGGGIDSGTSYVSSGGSYYGAAPQTGRKFSVPESSRSLSDADYSFLANKIEQVVAPKSLEIGVAATGTGGALTSAVAGLAGSGSALGAALGPVGFILSAAAMMGSMGIESYKTGKNIKQLSKEGSLRDLDRAFDSLRDTSVAGAFHPLAFAAMGFPGMLASGQFTDEENAGAAGLSMGALAFMPFWGAGAFALSALGMDSIFGDAKKRAKKRLIRRLRELTENLRESVKENLSGQVTPELLASLDKIFTADYLSREELNSIAAEGLDPFASLQLSLLQRSPAKRAYRAGSGLSMLQPGGSAPRSIPIINQAPFAEDNFSSQLNPDNIHSGIKAFQKFLVPLISEVRVAEGVREAMDLSVPLASMVPMRWGKKAAAYHATKEITDVSFSAATENAVNSANNFITNQYSGVAHKSPTIVNVESPKLQVNAKLSGGYSVELLARDLSFHTAKSLSASLGRLG